MINQYSRDRPQALEAVNASNRHQISPMYNPTTQTLLLYVKDFTYSLHVFNNCNKVANTNLFTWKDVSNGGI